MEYYSAIKKNKIMPFAAKQMDLEIIMLSEVSQKEKDKYHRISLISRHGFGWSLGVSARQGGLACCGSWGCKESDMTE